MPSALLILSLLATGVRSPNSVVSIPSPCCCFLAFDVGFRHRTGVLMPAWETFYQLCYLPSQTVNLNIPTSFIVVFRNLTESL